MCRQRKRPWLDEEDRDPAGKALLIVSVAVETEVACQSLADDVTKLENRQVRIRIGRDLPNVRRATK